ncbi:unknown protein [Oryza sativa Japonica Group]|uniref:Os01g0830300 protein n=1 Tax=Oryza sativa subsp. japonica TaxID=39947 RepID=Q941U9_ORYSJ|nr:unknown protein [Oryza sativa Japonica Group]BAB89589.1 unknown protein [Oryza sativa Japonica Group]BAF06610.1 Os01g0830300 [Oryza sativa Japonica Group]|eukprot:NP_001044696.1 Os01g0830300 [Oryza sativa Japonica Group]
MNTNFLVELFSRRVHASGQMTTCRATYLRCCFPTMMRLPIPVTFPSTTLRKFCRPIWC